MTFLKYHFLLAIAVVSMFGCSEKIKKNNITSKNPILSGISYASVKDSIELDLDEIFDSVYFVPLENNQDAFLGDKSRRILTNGQDIIVILSDKILHFDIDGSFKGKILDRGKGPQEYISTNSPIIIDRKLYFSDRQKKSHFVCFDLESSEFTFLKRREGIVNDLVLVNDSILYYILDTYLKKNILTTLLISQDLHGEIRSELVLGERTNKLRGLNGPYQLFEDKGNVFLSTPKTDTIWNLKNNQLNFCWSTKFHTSYNAAKTNQTFPKISLLSYTDEWLLVLGKEIRQKGRVHRFSDPYLVYVNRNGGKKGIVNTLLYKGQEMFFDEEKIHFISDEYMIFEFTAHEIVDLLSMMNQNTGLDNFEKNTLMEAFENVSIYDNLCLIIAKYKGS